MNHVAVAKSLSTDQIVELLNSDQRLEAQVKWFKQQKFGRKSEIRRLLPDSRQLFLGESLTSEDKDKPEKPVEVQTVNYQRKARAKKPTIPNCVSDISLQFDDTVEVREIVTQKPEIAGLDQAEYEVLGENVTYKIAQIPAVYRVLKFVQQAVKIKGKVSSNPKPQAVLEGTYADVSLLANLCIDKCLYHLPIYRQQQRIAATGIRISRNTLVSYVQRTAEVLEPVYREVLSSIRAGEIVWLDETPVKAGKENLR